MFIPPSKGGEIPELVFYDAHNFSETDYMCIMSLNPTNHDFKESTLTDGFDLLIFPFNSPEDS